MTEQFTNGLKHEKQQKTEKNDNGGRMTNPDGNKRKQLTKSKRDLSYL